MAENKSLSEILKGIYDSLTDEQKEKAKECKTTDELLKLASEEEIELPDELLDAVAGGYVFVTDQGVNEIIRDSDGEVIERLYGWDGYFNAEKRAGELGQSQDYISWKELEKLRRNARQHEPDGPAFWK